MATNVVSFVREKYPYILGLAAIEAGVYCLDGPAGNFLSGLLILIAIWIYYVSVNR
jgi:hypothetical protein